MKNLVSIESVERHSYAALIQVIMTVGIINSSCPTLKFPLSMLNCQVIYNENSYSTITC